MALEKLADELQAFTLSDAEYLLFRPTGDKEWLCEKFGDIPHYLFRVFTPKSCGFTDGIWTRSMDATYGNASSNVDILARDNHEVAGMLYRHLKWWPGPDDNLVSWTSSLLFALVYIFHLHANLRDRSTLGTINLCIIDTTSFPKGVFLRDMDLIQAYRSYNDELGSFESLRRRKHHAYSGFYYFGEYFSQGALKIEGKSHIVSAEAMINHGLYDLQPKFREFALWGLRKRPPWADPVLSLREGFYNESERQEITNEGIQAAVNIAQLFLPRWRMAIAINLIGLCPYRSGDDRIWQAFRTAPFTDTDRKNCSPSKTKVMAYDTLPEVQQCHSIMRSIYTAFCTEKLDEYVRGAEAQLRRATIFTRNPDDETVDLIGVDEFSHPMCPSHRAILQRLNTVAFLSQSLHQKLAGRDRKANHEID